MAVRPLVGMTGDEVATLELRRTHQSTCARVLANMTCPAMREMLARRGLPMTGNKATLRDRLLTGDPNKSKVYCKVRRKILTAVHNNINRFGEDGYGDKPDHMDPVEYWLSHLNPTIFNRID